MSYLVLLSVFFCQVISIENEFVPSSRVVSSNISCLSRLFHEIENKNVESEKKRIGILDMCLDIILPKLKTFEDWKKKIKNER